MDSMKYCVCVCVGGVYLSVGTGQAVSTLKIPIHISGELSSYCERSFRCSFSCKEAASVARAFDSLISNCLAVPGCNGCLKPKDQRSSRLAGYPYASTSHLEHLEKMIWQPQLTALAPKGTAQSSLFETALSSVSSSRPKSMSK